MSIEEILAEVKQICQKHQVQQAILFGSWAKGTATKYSDVDIAVSGITDIEMFKEALENIPTLRSFDVVDIERCKNDLLLKEIEEYGRKIL